MSVFSYLNSKINNYRFDLSYLHVNESLVSSATDSSVSESSMMDV